MDRMYAPWRLAFIKGQERSGPPTPSGCIFCDFPLRPGAPVPSSLTVEDAEVEVLAKDRAAWDRERLVLTSREHGFVILNKYPYTNGHIMVVPYQHTQQVESLDEATFAGLTSLLREAIAAVRAAYQPHGINVGMNMGQAGGAGIAEHVHWHVLPRWSGDVNFMPVLAETRVISEGLDDTYDRLAAILRRDSDDAA